MAVPQTDSMTDKVKTGSFFHGGTMSQQNWPNKVVSDDKLNPDTHEFELCLYADLGEAEDIPTLKQKILKTVSDFGFSDFAFIRGNCAGKNEKLITSPQKQIEIYKNSGFYQYDFVEEYRKNNTRAEFMTRLYQPAVDAPFDIETLKANREIYEVNQSFGYFEYYYIFMKSCHDDEKIMFACSRKGLDPASLQICAAPYEVNLKLLCQVIDYVVIQKFRAEFLDPEKDEVVTITPQPLRVLSALANYDLNITQLSEKLGISAVTVHHHITNARKSLGTRTNIGAIRKAIKLGLIKYE